MIDLQVADLPTGVNPHISTSYGLEIWEGLLKNSDTIKQYAVELSLDIVFSEVPFRHCIRTDPPKDWFERIEQAYQRGGLVKSRFRGNRTKWIVLYGHLSNMVPDWENPVHYASLGPDAIGALAYLEGGVFFTTREGETISYNQLNLAEEYFLKLVNEYGLIS